LIDVTYRRDATTMPIASVALVHCVLGPTILFSKSREFCMSTCRWCAIILVGACLQIDECLYVVRLVGDSWLIQDVSGIDRYLVGYHTILLFSQMAACTFSRHLLSPQPEQRWPDLYSAGIRVPAEYRSGHLSNQLTLPSIRP